MKIIPLLLLLSERSSRAFETASRSRSVLYLPVTSSPSPSASRRYLPLTPSPPSFKPSIFFFVSPPANDDENNSQVDGKEESSLRQIYDAANRLVGREDKHVLESSTFVMTPLVAGIVSFFLYPKTSIWFHQAVQALSNNNWESVDGGQLQWSILLPALNGVVMTAISLLYANLISTTGTQLRNRQITIHSSLSQEVEGLRGLIQLTAYYPDHVRFAFANCIQGYLRVLVEETDPDVQDVGELRSHSPPLSQYRDGLHSLGTHPEMNGNILERSYESLASISSARTTRITALQTQFPTLHYVTISVLTAVILLVFLLETDRKVILFLDKFQIRLVWGLLVGTLTAIYCIGIDLAQPFIGTYTVPAEQMLEDQLLMSLMMSQDTTSAGTTSTLATTTAVPASAPDAGMSTSASDSEVAVQNLPLTLSNNHHHQDAHHSDPKWTTKASNIAKNEKPTLAGGAGTVSTNEPTSFYDEYMRGRNQEMMATLAELYAHNADAQWTEKASNIPKNEEPFLGHDDAAPASKNDEPMSFYEEYMRGRNQTINKWE